MKTRHLALSLGLLLAAAAGTAAAHDRGYYPPPPPRGGASITLWGGSHGVAGWSGAVSLGAPVVIGTAYAPILAAPHYRHGPHCQHGHGRGHGKAYQRGYQRGYRNGRHDDDHRDRRQHWDD